MRYLGPMPAGPPQRTIEGMTFSTIASVIGGGLGILVLLALAVTPLLADLPVRRVRPDAEPDLSRVPAPRPPADGSLAGARRPVHAD